MTSANDDVQGNAANSKSSEDLALALLKRADVTAEAITEVSRNPEATKSHKVMLALTMHHRTPRHISLPLLRRLFIFDLMQVTLTPLVAADIKRAAEEQILNRLESLSIGEKTSLARRASGRVAAALLHDPDPRIISTALDNAHLVEASVVTALMRNDASVALFEAVSQLQKWSQRREVQIALLRSEKTPLPRARELAKYFSAEFLRELVTEGRRATIADAARATETQN
jgi:hypothetical protein